MIGADLTMVDLARLSPIGLGFYSLPESFSAPPHLELLNRKLLDVAAGRTKRLLVTCPPRHGKSMLTSHIFPAWFMGTFPRQRLLLTSYEANFAAHWGAKARDLLAEVGEDVWGIGVSRKRSASSWWATTQGGDMMTAGAGGAITGKGGHLGIIDDPFKNQDEANSPLQREKVWQWYLATFYTRIEPGGAIILIQTRWHEDDLAGRVLQHEQWEQIDFPALAIDEGDALGRKPGEALWPARYSREQLEDIRDRLGPYWWNSLYQQSPVPPEGALFKRDWFQRCRVGDLPKSMKLVRGWDEASSDDGDWTVGVLMGEHEGRYFLLDVVRGRWTPAKRDQVQQATRDRDHLRFSGRVLQWGQQDPAAAGKSRADAFIRMMAPARVGVDRPTGDKVLRADGFRSQAEAGNVFYVDGEWVEDFMREVTSFPYGTYDDQVDAASWAFEKLATMGLQKRGGFAPVPAWGF